MTPPSKNDNKAKKGVREIPKSISNTEVLDNIFDKKHNMLNYSSTQARKEKKILFRNKKQLYTSRNRKNIQYPKTIIINQTSNHFNKERVKTVRFNKMKNPNPNKTIITERNFKGILKKGTLEKKLIRENKKKEKIIPKRNRLKVLFLDSNSNKLNNSVNRAFLDLSLQFKTYIPQTFRVNNTPIKYSIVKPF